MTDWVEVRRRTRRKSRKMVQIFVKVDGGKTSVMEMETSDKVDDIVKKIPISDQDVYVTSGGRILRRSDKLESCEVRDGSTIQVTSRMRGGGKHKDKKSQKERKREVKQEGPEQKLEEELKRDKGPMIQEYDRDTVVQMIEESEENRKVMVRMLEENEDNRKMIESICDGSDVEVEQALQNYRTAGREVLGWDQGQADMMECGLRWAVEARREGRRQQEEEQRRQRKQGQHPGQEESKQDKQVDLGDEEQARAESTDEPEAMGRLAEVRTGRGSAGLVRGGDERCRADEISKGKGKGNGGKGEHEGKGDKGGKGFQQSTKMMKGEEELKSEENETEKELKREEEQETAEEDEGRVRMAPYMGAGGSHPQAMTDPEEEDDEGKEEEVVLELVGLETEGGDREKEVEEKKEQEAERKQEQEEERRAQEAREEESRAQEAREEESRAQEAREEKRRAQEAREEESRAQEAREEESRAQEAREEERRAQEAREKEARAQEEQAREEGKAQEERREERKVEAQEGHDGEEEMTTQENCVETKKEMNSMYEESDVSNRHMTWWRNAWWVRMDNGPHLRTARGRRRVWRAATRAAREARETEQVAGGEREKWEQGTTGRKESNTLHVVFHFPTATIPAAAAAATVRLQ